MFGFVFLLIVILMLPVATMSMRMSTHHKKVGHKKYHQEGSESQVRGYSEKR